uniref:Uncharacterized protein n=1 Tax=Octopus bimaculoides TaxID=37653 RepID=A0A0L8GX33_OCTBM
MKQLCPRNVPYKHFIPQCETLDQTTTSLEVRLNFLQEMFDKLYYTQTNTADEHNACLKKSLLWSHVQSKQLTINMRSLLQTGQPTTQFSAMDKLRPMTMDSSTLPPFVTLTYVLPFTQILQRNA